MTLSCIVSRILSRYMDKAVGGAFYYNYHGRQSCCMKRPEAGPFALPSSVCRLPAVIPFASLGNEAMRLRARSRRPGSACL